MRRTNRVDWGKLLFGGLLVAGGLVAINQVASPPDERAPGDKDLAASLRLLLARVATVLDVHAPRLALSRKVENAASDGKRILVNPDWARKTLATYCADQACGVAVMIGVLAHELIHHVYGDVETLRSKPWLRHECEIRADDGAGIALALLGTTPVHFARVAYCLTHRNSGGSPFGYPTPHQRVGIIRTAFERTRSGSLAFAA